MRAVTNSPRPSPPIPSAQVVADVAVVELHGRAQARARRCPTPRVVEAAIQWNPPSGRPAGIAGSPRRATSFSSPGSGNGDITGRKRPLSKS